MVTPRKKVQILIYPEIFNALAFYSKGYYAIHISVVQETQDGKLTYAIPTLVEKCLETSQKNKKPPEIKIQKNKKQAHFVTQQFFITYNEQNVLLHSMALFKLEIDPQTPTKTYINFKLILYRNSSNLKNSSKLSSSLLGMSTARSQIPIQLHHCKLYINNIMDLDQYKKIIFDQCETFSHLGVYIGSCYLGMRFRLHKYQYMEFFCMEEQERMSYQNYCENAKNKLNTIDRYSAIAKQINLDIKNFRMKLTELHSTYVHLKGKILSLIKILEQKNISFRNPNLLTEIKTILNYQINIETGIKTQEQLLKYYQTEIRQEIYLQIYQEMVEFDLYITYLWNKNIQLIHNISHRVFQQLIANQYQKQTNSKQKNMIVETSGKTEIRKLQQVNFLKRRKQLIADMKLYDEDDLHHPLIILQNYQKKNQQNVDISRTASLVVFVHGYQGSDYDLEKAKNFLNFYSPTSYALMIKSIQQSIDQKIQDLGQKVSQQIKKHITDSIMEYKRISLIGYSLGGVIARQAVKHLSQYKDKMNLLVTFASPHLGVSMPDNQLVKTGIWYLINVQKVKNLKQLNCQKQIDQQQQQFFLRKLSQYQSLGWFKKLVLISSQQDNFVPHHSARIDPENKSQIINEMAKNILQLVARIQRVEIWFDVDHNINTFDKILGRRAHIQFLQNRIFLDIFFRLYGKQF